MLEGALLARNGLVDVAVMEVGEVEMVSLAVVVVALQQTFQSAAMVLVAAAAAEVAVAPLSSAITR